MLEKFLNIFRIPDLRKRVLFTLGILAVYRLGSHIPTPGVNAHQLELLFSQQSGSALGLVCLCGGLPPVWTLVGRGDIADEGLACDRLVDIIQRFSPTYGFTLYGAVVSQRGALVLKMNAVTREPSPLL